MVRKSGNDNIDTSSGSKKQQINWNGLTWIDIAKPTSRDTDFLAEHYPFHHLDLDDCLSRIQRPKIDKYDDYLFIVLHFPVFNKESRVTVASQVSIFIGNGYLITLHSHDLNPLVKLFKDCQMREEARQDNMISSGYLLYRIVDRLVDYCLPILGKIMENLDSVENDIFDVGKRKTIQKLSGLRRDIISFRRVIWPLRAVIARLEHETARYTKEDMEVYWGDVIDHIDKIWDTLDECKEIIEGLSDTNNSLYSYRTNEIIRTLTIITTLILPSTLIVSIYGMNVALPGGLEKGGNLIPFFILLGIMVIVVGTMLVIFRRRGWL